ncbi:MAG: class I SAM-dependent methyltransferase [Caldilineaceae bacterium]|nr:class I SAM-dependent methyltransferase [Caldilineaceae bacterium]
MRQWYTQNWQQEVDFLEQELDIASGGRILDVGCGTGRHAVELARRGYQVTGLDFSAGMLAEAQIL